MQDNTWLCGEYVLCCGHQVIVVVIRDCDILVQQYIQLQRGFLLTPVLGGCCFLSNTKAISF